MTAGSADYTVGVKLTGDAVDLKAEVSSAESAITGLDTTVSQTSDSIVNTSGRKLKSAGKTIGTDFATSMTSGIASGDIAGSVSGIFSSLAAVGGLAAIGVGLGGALVTGLIKGAQQNAAEMNAAVNDLLSGVENDFKGSLESILDQIKKGVTGVAALEELGGDSGLAGGLDKARDFAQTLNLTLNDTVGVIEGKVNPATQDTVKALKEQANWTASQADLLEATVNPALHKALVIQNDQALRARELLDLYDLQRNKIDSAKEDARDLYNYTHQTALSAQQLAISSGQYAGNLERADAAARLLAGRRLPSTDVMNGN